MEYTPNINDIILFEKLWDNVMYPKHDIITDPYERYIWNQMHLFLNGSRIIKNINCTDANGKIIPINKLDDSLLFRELSGPIFRLLMESFFKVAYLHTGKNQEEKIERLDALASTLGHEYAKFIRITKEHPNLFEQLIRDLPPPPDTTGRPKLTMRGIFDKIPLSHLYGVYSIVCFYAHGTMDNIIWRRLFSGTNPPGPTINTFEMLYMMAGSYYSIAIDLWSNRFKEDFSKVK